MNNKLESVFKRYNVFSAKCVLCNETTKVHSIKYIGKSKNDSDEEREGVILIRPGFAKDYEVRGVLHHFWQEINRAGLESDKLCFLFDMDRLRFSIQSFSAAIAMYSVIRTFTSDGIGRILVVNPSKQLTLFLKAIPFLRIEDVSVIKLEELSNLLINEQLQFLLP